MAANEIRDGMELSLMPDIGKTVLLVLGFFLRLFLGLRTTKHIAKEHAVILGSFTSLFEVCAQRVTRIKNEITEIECGEQINFWRLNRHDVGFDQAHACPVLFIQSIDAMLSAPFKHRWFDIDADSLEPFALSYPLATEARRSAEIFAKQIRYTACKRLERRLQKFNFVFDVLYRQLVELVNVGSLGHRLVFVSGFGAHSGFDILR